MFEMGSVLQLASRWFKVLRTAYTLRHPTDHRQVSKLDQFGTVQCSVMMNNHVKFRGNSYKPFVQGWTSTGFWSNRMPQIFYFTVQRLRLLSYRERERERERENIAKRQTVNTNK
jgi:hypothetical protein